MTIVEAGSKRLGLLIGGVQNAVKMDQLDIASVAPLLDSKMLRSDVACTRCGTLLVDHGNGCLIILVEHSRLRRRELQVCQDGTKEFCHLTSNDSGIELSFGTRCSNNRLELRLVRNSSTSETEGITSNRTARDLTRCMQRIDKANKFGKNSRWEWR
jgi:hypothetical protein